MHTGISGTAHMVYPTEHIPPHSTLSEDSTTKNNHTQIYC